MNQRTNFCGKSIRGYADNPPRSDRHEPQRQRIVAAQYRKRLRQPCPQLADALDAPARFLNRDNILALPGETHDCIGSDIHAAPARNIVKHDWQRRRLGDGLEMPEQTFLAWLVVIWREIGRAHV